MGAWKMRTTGKIIRRFIPKGHAIEDYRRTQIRMIEVAMNNLPRKIFAYKTPHELFEEELLKRPRPPSKQKGLLSISQLQILANTG